MNIFRLVGDSIHLLALIFLPLHIWKNRSCAGISGKSQMLFTLVFLTRYLDLLTIFISTYTTVLKIVFIGLSSFTVYLVYFKFNATYEANQDSFPVGFLIVPVAGLAVLVNHERNPLEVLWAFSIYLEAVAVLPQLFMISKSGRTTIFIFYYLLALGIYRTMYVFNWQYRFNMEGFVDRISIVGGCVQTSLYFIWLLGCCCLSAWDVRPEAIEQKEPQLPLTKTTDSLSLSYFKDANGTVEHETETVQLIFYED